VAKRWLRPKEAARLIVHLRRVSTGASLPILRDAMSSGEVRVRSVADPGKPEYLPAELWLDATFDLDRNIITGADRWGLERGLSRECQYDALEISHSDLEYWLQARVASDEQARSAKGKRKRRHNEKRPEIVQAIAALAETSAWKNAGAKERCKLVEEHLKRDAGWCRPRTLDHAITEFSKTGPPS
jgi:hypothetical protein